MMLLVPANKINEHLTNNSCDIDLCDKYVYNTNIAMNMKQMLLGVVTCHDDPIPLPSYDDPEGFNSSPTNQLSNLTSYIYAGVVLNILNGLTPYGTIVDLKCDESGVIVDVSISERPGSY